MWFAYLYRRGATASEWVPDPDEVAAATTEAACVTGILEPPWDATYELGVDPLPEQIPDIRAQVVAPVPRLFARVDTADWTGQTYEYVGVQEDPTAPLPLPPNPLPREPLEEHSVHAVHLLPPVGTAGQLLALDTNQELSWLSPGTIALEDGSVTTAKLAPDAVTADKIVDGSITGAELAAGTITADKLAAGVVPPSPGAASDSTPGLIQIATTAEVQAGTDTLKAVTPGRLVSRTATDTRTGLVELATTAEAVEGTDTVRAVTPAGLQARIDALPVIPQASEATPGIVSLATQIEVTTGTDDTKALTPLKLAAKLVPASETQRGLVELATQAETTGGTNDLAAVTPLKLQQRLEAVLPGPASESTSGILRLASFNDVNTGIDHSKAVTPQGLQQRLAALPLASTGNAGLVELATNAETTTGTDTQRAVTPAGLAAKVPSGTPLSVARYAADGATVEEAPGVVTNTPGGLKVTLTDSPAAVFRAVDSLYVTTLQANSSMSHFGVFGEAVLDQAGFTATAVPAIRGIYARATASGASGTINHLAGVMAVAQNISAGTVGNAYANYSTMVNTGGTITNGYGFYVPASAAVAADNFYGLFLQGALGSGKWNLFVDGQAHNYLRGNLGIGTASFSATLDRGLAFGPGTLPSTSPVDTVQLAAVDRGGTAGKRSLTIRTEDGTSHVLGDLVGLGTLLTATLGSGASYQALNVKGSTLYVEQSSVQERALGLVQSTFVNSTDATRTGRMTLSVYDFAALREGLRLEADGSAARLSFHGVPAVARQAVPAAGTDAGTVQTLVNSLRSALINYGLCV